MNSAGFNAALQYLEDLVGGGGYVDCNGAPIADGDALATCADLADAIAALPADKYLQGLSSYNAAINMLTLAMSDGSFVTVDMTALVADAVASVPAPDGSETIVTAGANVTVTGTGTSLDPYVVVAAGGGGGSPTGPAGGGLSGSYPNPALVPASVLAALALKNCAGVAHAIGANVPSCAEMNAAIAAVPVPDGSETKVTAGANVTVTGTGTTASPYVVAAAGGGSVTTDGKSIFGSGTVGSPLNALITNDPTLHNNSPSNVLKSTGQNMILSSSNCFMSGNLDMNFIAASSNSQMNGTGFARAAMLGCFDTVFDSLLSGQFWTVAAINCQSSTVKAGGAGANIAFYPPALYSCRNLTHDLSGGNPAFGAQSPAYLGVNSLTVDHTVLTARVIITGPGATQRVAIGGATATEKLHVYGNILATGTITPSDASLKENVADDAGEWVLKLAPKTYTMKAKAVSDIDAISKPSRANAESGKTFSAAMAEYKAAVEEEKAYIARETAITRHGFIAQEVQAVAPELVRQSGGILTLDYQGVIAGLVAQVQALNRRLDAAGI